MVSLWVRDEYFSRYSSAVLVEAIRGYIIPEEKEDYIVPVDPSSSDGESHPAVETGEQRVQTRSNLRLFPPPLFSRQGISQNYKYPLRSYLRSNRILMVLHPLQLQSKFCVNGHYYGG
jgi:hypothetical protein